MAKKVMIDPGHGGTDPGAIGPSGVKEKDVTLAVAKKLNKLITTTTKANTLLTRNSDTTLKLADRTRTANNANADYYISIHCNAANSPEAHGTETYYYATSNTGRHLAETVQAKVVSATGLTNRGIKTGNFYVLRKTQMPAILIELAFISNPNEEKLLKSSSFQNTCAEAILEGLQEVTGLKDNKASSWAREAWEWAKKAGITDGTRPRDTITREEVVTMLYRFNKKISRR